MEKESKLVKRMHFVLAACKHCGLQEYSCKHSRKDFRQSQLVAMLVFKQETEKDYRTAVEFFGEMPRVYEAISLKKLPHFTTLQKALARFPPALLEEILAFAALLAVYGNCLHFKDSLEPQDASFDGTGLFLTNASRYFQERLKRKVSARHFLHSVVGTFVAFLLIFCAKQRREQPAAIVQQGKISLPEMIWQGPFKAPEAALFTCRGSAKLPCEHLSYRVITWLQTSLL